MIAGPRFSETRVLALANAYERATEWHNRKPPLAPDTPSLLWPSPTKTTRDAISVVYGRSWLAVRRPFSAVIQSGDSSVKPHDVNPTLQAQSGEVTPNELLRAVSRLFGEITSCQA